MKRLMLAMEAWQWPCELPPDAPIRATKFCVEFVKNMGRPIDEKTTRLNNGDWIVRYGPGNYGVLDEASCRRFYREVDIELWNKVMHDNVVVPRDRQYRIFAHAENLGEGKVAIEFNRSESLADQADKAQMTPWVESSVTPLQLRVSQDGRLCYLSQTQYEGKPRPIWRTAAEYTSSQKTEVTKPEPQPATADMSNEVIVLDGT